MRCHFIDLKNVIVWTGVIVLLCSGHLEHKNSVERRVCCVETV